MDALIKNVTGHEKIGATIVRRALEEPLRQIVGNAGEEGALAVGKVIENANPYFGYNADTNEYEDLVEAGVIDPTKVTRIALQNAASIACLMLTTEAMVADIPEPKMAPRSAVILVVWGTCIEDDSGRSNPHLLSCGIAWICVAKAALKAVTSRLETVFVSFLIRPTGEIQPPGACLNPGAR